MSAPGSWVSPHVAVWIFSYRTALPESRTQTRAPGGEWHRKNNTLFRYLAHGSSRARLSNTHRTARTMQRVFGAYRWANWHAQAQAKLNKLSRILSPPANPQVLLQERRRLMKIQRANSIEIMMKQLGLRLSLVVRCDL